MDKEFLEGLGLQEDAVNILLEQLDQLEQDHKQALAQAQFDGHLALAVERAGGRNLTAIRALLDEKAILSAQQPEVALKDALAELKKSCGYLFESPVPPVFASGTGTGVSSVTEEPKSLAEALREKFRRK